VAEVEASDRNACAKVLAERQLPLARALLRSACTQARWQARADERAADLDVFLREEFCVFADYLRFACQSGDKTWQHLYVGEKLRQLYRPRASDEERLSDCQAVLAGDLAALEAEIRPHLPDPAWQLLRAEYQQISDLLEAPADRELRVLLVGDCLYMDLVAFLVAPLLAKGMRIRPEFATSKNPAMLRRQLQAMAAEPFDVIFYSPFTYLFSIALEPVLSWKSRLRGRALTEAVDSATRAAGGTLDLLADLFDCPIHVHNTALVLREVSATRRRVKNLITGRRRRRARERIDSWARAHIAERNERTFKQLFLVDELALANAHPENDLGAYFHRSSLHHPAAFSRIVAEEYVDLLCVHARLASRKLVVCDLDNTLWDGVIGEGEVEHYHDRQEVLKRLRQRGVVLAINSKNDPAAVHWRGGTLGDDDFAAASIDWRPKVAGMRDLEERLNLKPRDWVFLDDRPDEREMIQSAFPDLLTLDPDDPATWRQMRIWADLLDEKPELDRTQLYRDREERKRFLEQSTDTDDASEELFRTLELRAVIRSPQPGDLRRVGELINRTNQFNMRGSRTNDSEVQRWHKSDDTRILLADVTDRFGQMGTVSVLVAQQRAGRWEIEVFVLSCRVFGYGIETAVLNALKRAASETGCGITGEYVETDRNQPCRDAYPLNGFTQGEDGHWSWQAGGETTDPVWLEVADES